VGAAQACSATRTLFTRGYGGPDDLAVYRGAVYFGDIHTDVVAKVAGGHKRIVARRLATPEGIVFRNARQMFVVEQGRNRLDIVDVRTGTIRVVNTFRNTTGLEGVDGIASGGRGTLLIPDSPYGTLWLRKPDGSLRLLRSGFFRPVDAIRYGGGIAIADENANAVWFLKDGTVSRLATVPTPDDLAIAAGHLYAVTLGDGGLWEVRPRVSRLPVQFRNPQGLVDLSARVLLVADGNLNALYRVAVSHC